MEHFRKRLSPGKQKKNNKPIFGFDIETDIDNKNAFVCASVYGDNYQRFMRSKREVIEEFQHHRYRNSIIAATNLGFDFFGTFLDAPEIQKFSILFRGSFLLYAKTHLDDSSRFFRKLPGQKAHGTLTFLDTLNFAGMGVEDMGKILKMPKLDIGSKIGKVPKNNLEWMELEKYNMRDAMISRDFMVFLYKGFDEAGASPKITIASTAMSLFRNKYLKDTYYVQAKDDIKEIMQAYYGGRTETFKRGMIRERNYYDLNSAYPFAMTKELPNPNTHRVTHKNNLDHIRLFEGCSKVSIVCPDNIEIPYLPVKYEGMLLFPTGSFTGWYTHFELRKALSMGYRILQVFKTHYYKGTCAPLKDYALDMYAKRKKAKDDAKAKGEYDPMELVYKLFMNSLYGKFGQRFEGRESYQPIETYSAEELNKLGSFERIGDFIKSKTDGEPSHFCIPIWAAYITAYTRDLLHSYLIQCDPDYCDTDSITTERLLPTGSALGELKLEMKIKEGVIVRNKMYAFIDSENKEIVKIKGVMKRVKVKAGGDVTKLNYSIFSGLEANNMLYYDKFTKFKEGQRTGKSVNEVIECMKVLDLEDTKRSWPSKFSFSSLQRSMPLRVIDGIPEMKVRELMRKAKEKHDLEVQRDIESFIESDLFDGSMAGKDDPTKRLMFESERDAYKYD